MRRREFITFLCGAAAWPLAANGQQAENPVRIGFLPLGSPSDTYDQSLVEAFRDGLRKVGIVENRQVMLDFAWVRNESELPQAVTELMQRGAKLLITCGTSASVAAKRQVSTIPIVFITVGNPVGVGLVASLLHPGGNATGFSDMHADLGGKYVEFAIELGKPQAPVDCLWYSGWADGQHRLQVTERAAQLLGVKLRIRAITDIAEANDAFATIKAGEAVTVIIQSSPFSYRHREQLISSAMKHGLGAIYAHPQAARDGALIAYGPDYINLNRRAASYVERIIKGTKPADLPVQQPTKFELVINLKTAKALGLMVPSKLLLTADEVIE